MSILVFGKTGQVATELLQFDACGDLAKHFPGLGPMTLLGRDQADLTDPEKCAQIIADSDAKAVINAAAYTGVDKAEDYEATAHMVNATAPGAMAKACAAKGIPFIHISTDYVFDGSGDTPRSPDAPTNPINAYGRTKRAGEEAVQEAGGQYAILRTSWVFSAHGNNFVKTMLRLGAERDRLTIVADQVGGPTPAYSIAVACLSIADSFQQGRGTTGTYHFSGTPDTSWSDFAREIFRRAGLSPEVVDISTPDFPTPAERPLNSRLDCSSLEQAFGVQRPDWQNGLQFVLDQLEDAANRPD